MNEEAQRIAIATYCGVEPIVTWRRKEDSAELVAVPGSEDWSDAPDYLNDLNAMHEAEKTLRIGVDLHIGQRWFGYLANVVSGKQMYLNEYDWPGAAYFICRATAAQRAEAFLRTIGKWEDGK